MRIFGLTGGIACGKSTAARMFEVLGAGRVDADELARAAATPGSPVFPRIVGLFGSGVLDADGDLDRRAVRRLVFADPALKRRLEAIIHPEVAVRSAERFADFMSRGVEIVIYEAALLVETGAWRNFDGLAVVTVTPETQSVRLTLRDGMSEIEARAMIASQAPQEVKTAAADWVIANDGDVETLAAEVEEVWQKMKSHPGRSR